MKNKRLFLLILISIVLLIPCILLLLPIYRYVYQASPEAEKVVTYANWFYLQGNLVDPTILNTMKALQYVFIALLILFLIMGNKVASIVCSSLSLAYSLFMIYMSGLTFLVPLLIITVMSLLVLVYILVDSKKYHILFPVVEE